MITLALESTAKVASVAIGQQERVLARYHIDNGLTQSELLLPMVEAMLAALHLTFQDIELLACTVGPGSFTGVRIGAALVKGIAFSRQIPCVPVSALEALAENLTPLPGVYVPVMDARRGQFYTAIFRGEADGTVTRLAPDAALSTQQLTEQLQPLAAAGETIYLVGDGYAPAHRALTEAGISLSATPALLRDENAAGVLRAALRLYRSGAAVSDTELLPTYLRLPQAERERLARQQSESAPAWSS